VGGLTHELAALLSVPDIEIRFRTALDPTEPRRCYESAMEYQELLSGFIRLHVLHHAAEGDLYGQWMIEELARHGYRLSPGTLYPMLDGMEKRGYLVSRRERAGRSVRRLYSATPLGREALVVARTRLRELFRELVEVGGTPEAPS
jgi:PadR family transcriptional regulator PadR